VTVDGTAELLDLLEAYFRRYLILTDSQVAALCVWTVHTYIYALADTTPYLIVTSAEKRSGKTRAIETLGQVAHGPQAVTSLTEAVLFRLVSQEKPTLMIDETDAIFRDARGGPNERQEGLRAVLNAGYRRGTLIPRMLPTGEIARFECYCPKLLAGIGHLPETIEDRGLTIRLKRKLPTDKVERFRHREVSNGQTMDIRLGLSGWAPRAKLALAGIYPEMPAELDDRAQDAYEILVLIGDAAGEPWAGRVRTALVELRTEQETVQESQGVRLLRDVSVIADRLAGMEKIATADLLELLYVEGEQPWEEWWGEAGGKKAARRLALVLGEYGVKPEQMWIAGANKRGYATGPLLETLGRYTGIPNARTLEGADLQGDPEKQNPRMGTPPSVLKSAHLQGSSVSSVSDADTSPQGQVLPLESRIDELDW
jgi:hypothetical protein